VGDTKFLLLFSESAHETTQELGKIIEKVFSLLACVIVFLTVTFEQYDLTDCLN